MTREICARCKRPVATDADYNTVGGMHLCWATRGGECEAPEDECTGCAELQTELARLRNGIEAALSITTIGNVKPEPCERAMRAKLEALLASGRRGEG